MSCALCGGRVRLGAKSQYSAIISSHTRDAPGTLSDSASRSAGSRRAPKTGDVVADGYVAAVEIGAGLLSQPREQIKAYIAVAPVAVFDMGDRRGERRDQVRLADDANQLSVALGDRHQVNRPAFHAKCPDYPIVFMCDLQQPIVQSAGLKAGFSFFLSSAGSKSVGRTPSRSRTATAHT